MTLEEWVKEARSELDLFVEFWTEQNGSFPDNWPLDMPSGDWDEQFIGYKAHRRPPGDKNT